MNRQEFKKQLKHHDWYYAYSDDYEVYSRGRDAGLKLKYMARELGCPFDMSVLRKWAHNMVLENFTEESPGKYYSMPRQKRVAASSREDLITQQQFDDVEAWLSEDDDE